MKRSYEMNMTVEGVSGRYGDLLGNVVVLDNMVEVGESWA